MSEKPARTDAKASAREERLKDALRENLKRRKMQARGRAGAAIVTPEDDAAARDPKRE